MTTTERPEALADQLRWVHDILRRDLETVRELARRVADGASTREVREGLADLEAGGPLFQLRATCLGYCQLLHSHHGGESDVLFPAVRRAAPRLAATVDRLEADHREISAVLNEIEALAQDLDESSARAALVAALTRLSTGLLEHLAHEEETIGPVLDSWDEWPVQ
jgi:iron-sulfur cluster repair protein YtfE (RIC family)